MSTRYSDEFKDRAFRLLSESLENYTSETKALQGMARRTVCCRGVAAVRGCGVESQQRWGDSYGNALAETINGACKTELVRRLKPFDSVRALEQATFQRVSWRNGQRLHERLGNQTPDEVETQYHQHQATSIVPKNQQNSANKPQFISHCLFPFWLHAWSCFSCGLMLRCWCWCL
ncbi:integrase core domain-containing protein [Bifidobacterium aquikefiricola]|uniref:integrase core domain-containing protein n=1 Tax=Bifidobacterium TaxID=1678 RepID=UPI003857E1B2